MVTTVSTEVIKTWERYETLSAFSNKQYLARSLWRLWGWSLLCAHWASWRSRRRRRRRQTVVVRRSILIQACLAVNSYQHLAPLPPSPFTPLPPPPRPLITISAGMLNDNSFTLPLTGTAQRNSLGRRANACSSGAWERFSLLAYCAIKPRSPGCYTGCVGIQGSFWGSR